MKKNRIYIILVVILAAIAGYFLYTNSNSTIRTELRDFAVEDTASIDKIFLADRQGKTVLLERKSSAEWTVNGKFPARQDKINTLLYTVKLIEIRSPVGKNLYNYAMKMLSSNSTKVEIYQHKALAKVYYVGDATMDNLGTFMYLEGSSVPFIMHIPGFNGYLTTRYFVAENDWKSRSVFNYFPGSIVQVKVTNFVNPDSSFILEQLKDSSYSIVKNNGQRLAAIDQSKIVTYLSAYQNINYEMIFEGIPDRLRDSLLKNGPFNSVEVKLADGRQKQVSLFRKKFTGETLAPDDEGIVLDNDPDIFYLTIGGDKTWYISQYLQWNRLLKTSSYFIPYQGGK